MGCTGSKAAEYPCTKCERTFVTPERCLQHMRDAHVTDHPKGPKNNRPRGNSARKGRGTKRQNLPPSMVSCKFGTSCHRLKAGTCMFKHSNDNESAVPACKYGDTCTKKKAGTCQFKHSADNESADGPTVVDVTDLLNEETSV